MRTFAVIALVTLVPTVGSAQDVVDTVIRVRDGVAEWVDVKRGATMDNLIEAVGNLKAGEQVALRGTDEIPRRDTGSCRSAGKQMKRRCDS